MKLKTLGRTTRTMTHTNLHALLHYICESSLWFFSFP